ncbi:arginyl-tRNA---protein transferase, partial [Tremellales sp. Uapishka_1]
MARTCCPNYTIRLDATSFRPGKKHRQVVNRFNRFLATGQKRGEGSAEVAKPTAKGEEGGFLRNMKKIAGRDGKHRFTTELVPAESTYESFELYRKYQVAVHGDKDNEVTLPGFQRFLCDSNLMLEPIRYSALAEDNEDLPQAYGSYHLLYKVDSELIALSVMDILPNCVSSVYFIWHPDWAWASLGKLSALHEMALVEDMRDAGAPNMAWLYMGYWIANCQKMKYKSEYEPSYLLDPGTNQFHLLTPHLERFLVDNPRGYHPFANIEQNKAPSTIIEHSPAKSATWPVPTPPGFADPSATPLKEINDLVVLTRGANGKKGSRLARVEDLDFNSKKTALKSIRELVAAVGKEFVVGFDDLDQGLGGKGILYFG